MGLREDVQKMMHGSRIDSVDSGSQIKNLEAAVRELQGVVGRLADEIERLKG
jgi:hypothetical protein